MFTRSTGISPTRPGARAVGLARRRIDTWVGQKLIQTTITDYWMDGSPAETRTYDYETTATGERVEKDMLPAAIRGAEPAGVLPETAARPTPAPAPATAAGSPAGSWVSEGLGLAAIERIVIETTIERCQGSIPEAARVLGVSPSTIYRKRGDVELTAPA